jgi:hypothetical protein
VAKVAADHIVKVLDAISYAAEWLERLTYMLHIAQHSEALTAVRT